MPSAGEREHLRLDLVHLRHVNVCEREVLFATEGFNLRHVDARPSVMWSQWALSKAHGICQFAQVAPRPSGFAHEAM
eukprot:250889-Chlamydomonas_euryale.AAC.1